MMAVIPKSGYKYLMWGIAIENSDLTVSSVAVAIAG